MKLGSDSLLESSGTSDIAEPILCTYMDLDRLIEDSGMTQEQRIVIDLIMQGWTEMDIAQARGCSRQAVCRLFRDGVEADCRSQQCAMGQILQAGVDKLQTWLIYL